MPSPTTPIIPAGQVATPVVPTSQPPIAPPPGQGTGVAPTQLQTSLATQQPLGTPQARVSASPPPVASPSAPPTPQPSPAATSLPLVSYDGGRTYVQPGAPAPAPAAPVSTIPPAPTAQVIAQGAAGTPVQEQLTPGRQPAPSPVISGTPAQVPDYAELLPPEQRLTTPSGRPLAAGERESAVLNMFNAGMTDPTVLQRYFNVNQGGNQPSAYTLQEIQSIIGSQARPGAQVGQPGTVAAPGTQPGAVRTQQQQIAQTQSAISALQGYIASTATAPSIREEVLTLQRALDSVGSGVVTSDFADNVRASISRVLTSLNSQQIPPLPDFSAAIAATQARLNEIGTRINDPLTDPLYRETLAREQEIEQDRLEAVRRIEVTGTRQYDEQVELNKQALGRAQVAMAGARLTGSPIAADYITSVINQGQRILSNINEDIQKAITDANSSFRQQRYEIAIQKIEYIEKLKDKRDTMVNQQLELSQKLYEAQTQRVEMQNQLEERYYQRQRNLEEDRRLQRQEVRQERMDERAIAREDRQYAMADMELFLKGNVDASAITDEIYEDLGKKLGRTSTEAKKLYSGLMAEKTAEEAAKKAKTDAELNQSRLTALRAEREIASSLNPGEEVSYTRSDGTTKTITGAFNLRDAKQYQIETTKGRELVTVDLQGKEIGRTRLGANYVAPQYDEDIHEWRAYDPLRDSEDTIQDNGPYDEGVKVYTTGKDIVGRFSKKYGKPSQEPGGSFTHGNTMSWDYMMKVGTPIDSPVSGVVVEARNGVTQQYNHPSKGNVDYGNYVEILDEATGMRVRLAHLKDLNLKKGDRISAGTLLGHSGHTGCSTGPHLHLEFLTSDGKAISPNNQAVLEKKFILGGDIHGRAKESIKQVEPSSKPTDSSFDLYEQATGVKLNPKSDRDKSKVAQFMLDRQKTTETVKPLSGEAAKLRSITETVDPEIDTLITAFKNDYRGTLGGIVTGKNRKMVKLLDNIADKVGRLRSGGAINKDEADRFKSQIASFMDIPFGDPNDAIDALNSLKDEARVVRESIVVPSRRTFDSSSSSRPIDPASTQIGDTTILNGRTYTWDGTKWN